MPLFWVWKAGLDPFSSHLYGQESGIAILPAQACLQQCLWETSPFLSTDVVTNVINRSDNRRCPSAVLVVFRKKQLPPAMFRHYYALHLVLLCVRLIWLWLGAHIYMLMLTKSWSSM